MKKLKTPKKMSLCASFSGDAYFEFENNITREDAVKVILRKIEKNSRNRTNLQVHVIQDLDNGDYLFDN